MPIDTNTADIYNNVWKPDPMQGVTLQEKYLAIRNAAVQNQLLQQQQKSALMDLLSKQALASGVQQNTDPNTGMLNTSGLNAFTAARGNVNQLQQIQQTNALNAPNQLFMDPKTKQITYASPQVISHEYNPGNPQQSQDQVDRAHEQLDYLGNKADELLALPDSDLTLGKVQSSIADIGAEHTVSNGRRGIPYQSGGAELAGPDFPRGGPNGEPPQPQELRQYIQNHRDKFAGAKQLLNQQHGPHSSQYPTHVMAVPPGYENVLQDAQGHVAQVRNARENVGNINAVLSEIEQLSKEGTPSGTAIADLEKRMAQSGFAPENITQEGANMQVMSKYMEQAALASGMPSSDARLAALHAANTNPEQLPQAIQALVPFLRAANEGSRTKANYYDHVIGNTLDYDKINQARNEWSNNYDPRGILLDQLSKEEKSKYLKTLGSKAEADKVIKASRFVRPYLQNQ